MAELPKDQSEAHDTCQDDTGEVKVASYAYQSFNFNIWHYIRGTADAFDTGVLPCNINILPSAGSYGSPAASSFTERKEARLIASVLATTLGRCDGIEAARFCYSRNGINPDAAWIVQLVGGDVDAIVECLKKAFQESHGNDVRIWRPS